MTGPGRLTAEQRAAVEAPDGPLLIVAPPGSGKTEVLMQRALWLVVQSAGEPFRVLALTFTNKAAEELAARARSTLAEESWRVEACTIHSFCLDMIQRYGEAVGVTGELSICETEQERLELLGQALDSAAYTVEIASLGALLQQIDAQRAGLVPPELAPLQPLAQGAITLREAYGLYEAALDDAGTIDFPGMLYRGWRLLEEDPWVGSHYRRQYRHVLVDEAQDLTRTQMEVLRSLCGEDFRNIFVVADDDQEIFTFAGASSEHYSSFAREIGAKTHQLTVNFRSAVAVVEAAERLRSHFRTLRVGGERVRSATTAPGWIGTRSFDTPDEEASGVTRWIADLLDGDLPRAWLAAGEDGSLRPEDVCVMARTRFALDPLLPAMEVQGLEPVVRTGEGALFDSLAGQVLYLALRVLANPRDRASRRRLEQASAGGTGLSSVAEGRVGYEPMTQDRARVAERLNSLGLPGELVDVACRDAPMGSLEAAERLREPPPAAAPDGAQGRERELWEADLDQLASHWDRYSALTRVPDRSLLGFLRQLSRIQRTPPDAPGVRLLTPYRAKGLQFRVVVVVGMVNGSFPHYRATTEREVDEERRAVYVALTRAARAALLTYPRQRTDRWGRTHRDPPSVFLGELGLEAD